MAATSRHRSVPDPHTPPIRVRMTVFSPAQSMHVADVNTLTHGNQPQQPVVGRSAEAESECTQPLASALVGEGLDLPDHGQRSSPTVYTSHQLYKRPVLASALMASLVFAVAVPLFQNMNTEKPPNGSKPAALQVDQRLDDMTATYRSSQLKPKLNDRWPSEEPAERDLPPSQQKEAPIPSIASLNSPLVDQSEQQPTPMATTKSHPQGLAVASHESADVPTRVRTFIVYPDGTVVRPSKATMEPARAATTANLAVASAGFGNSPSGQPDIQASRESKSDSAATASSAATAQPPVRDSAQPEVAQPMPPNSDPVSMPLPTRKPVVARVRSAARVSSPSSAPQWQEEVFAR